MNFISKAFDRFCDSIAFESQGTRDVVNSKARAEFLRSQESFRTAHAEAVAAITSAIGDAAEAEALLKRVIVSEPKPETKSGNGRPEEFSPDFDPR